MSSRKTKRFQYALLLVLSSVFGSSAVNGYSVLEHLSHENTGEGILNPYIASKSASAEEDSPFAANGLLASMPYSTIIESANEEVVCGNDGSTLSKFFLCGTSDIRTISLSVSGSTYEWQKLDENTCAPTVVDDCPTISTSCVWDTVGTNATYDLGDPGEYRVRVNSGQFYYFKVTQNPLDPQLVYDDIICGANGRVEVTNVPSGYEYSLNSTTGPFQDDPFFDISTAGSYTVYVRLKDVSATACLFPSNTINVQELDMVAQATKTDILCNGEQGSISINVSGVPGFYTYRLQKNGVTVDTYGPNNATSYVFNNVGSGDYSVRVQTNDCDILVDADINGDPLTIGNGIDPLVVTASASDSFGCGATSVDVTVNTTGGTAPYRFSVDGGAFSATYADTATFPVSSPGTYSVLVQDANGCEHSAVADVTDIPPPIFNVSADDAICAGTNTGQVTVNVTSGFGYNLEYSIDNGTTYQISNVFSSLGAGTYTVMLRYTQDTFSCTTPVQAATIAEPLALSGSATADAEPNCTNEFGGQISFAIASGGVPPYQYSIGAGFNSTTVFGSLGVGSYTPQVRDGNGCILTLPTIVFDPLQKPTDIDFTISALDCLASTATLALTATGGTAPYSYEIISPASAVVNNGSNPSFANLGLGSYTFRIIDVEGCDYEENYAITDISSIRVQAQQLSAVSCFTDSNGEGRFLVDTFTTSYSYNINGGAEVTGQTDGQVDVSGLASGDYVITVTDEDTNCTASATLTIQGPTSAFTLHSAPVVPMSCQNGNVGSARILAFGGWGGHQYTLLQPDGSTIPPTSGNTFSNLTQSGSYTITATDLNGCSVSDTFSLTPMSEPTLSIDAVASDFCYDPFDAATLAVTTTSGTAPYQYRINNGTFGTLDTFTGLTPDTYTIEVADANDCRDVLTVTIAPQLSPTATIVQELECSGPDGAIQVIIIDGYPSGSSYVSYEVSIDGGAYSTDNNPISGNSFIHAVPNDGSITTNTSYRFLVTDGQGCTNETNEVVISPQETISGTATVTDTRCGNADGGIVTLMPDTTMGIPPYEYSDDGGTTFGSQSVFAGYAPGTYTNFVIRDSRGCVSPPISATITASTALNATLTTYNATCSLGSVEGSIDATITSGGDAPFTYTLFDVEGNVVNTIGPTTSTTVSFIGLSQGDYTVVTSDSFGCEDSDDSTIGEDGITITPAPIPIASCVSGFSNTITINGGVGPFLIRLVGEGVPRYSPNSPPRTHTFSGLDFGTTYFVEVEDTGTGCIYIEEIPPYTGPSSILVTTTGQSASCNLLNNGAIDYNVVGALGANIIVTVTNTDDGTVVFGPNTIPATDPYSDSITNLSPGNYQVTVEDPTNGCTNSAGATVAISSPSIIVDSATPASCNANALVVVRGASSTAPYTFAYVPNGDAAPTSFSTDTSFEIPGPYPSDYDFYVQDANGCLQMVPVTVTETAGVPDPTIDVVNQCTATSGYQVDVLSPLDTGSGLPEDTFQYDIGSGYQDSPNFIVSNPGTYTITVRDGYGCTNTVVAEVFDFFAISADATSEPTCNSGDGVITVSTYGGSGNFEFQLYDDDTGLPIGSTQPSNMFSGIDPGNYRILVTDLSSNTTPLCSDDAYVNVSTVTAPIISATTPTQITCFGADDGTITVELQSGTDTDTPLQYSLYNGATTTIVAGPQSSPIFTNLTSGTYQAEVVSSRGCSDRSPDIAIDQPTQLQLNLATTDFTCDPSNNQYNTATITAFVDTNGDGTGTNTGTASYSYSMNDGTPAFDGTNFQPGNTFSVIDNGGDQTITITVRDARGCEVSETLTIPAPSNLTFTFAINGITCDASGTGVNPGSITLIMDQGPSNYEVELLPYGSEPTQSSGGTDRVAFPIATPGDYIFSVTDHGTGGCRYLTPIVSMPDYNTAQALIAETSPVSCFNATDGEISLTLNGYTGLYNYEVFSRDNTGAETSTGVTGSFDTENPMSTPEVIGGLPAGNLVVYLRALDSPFCDIVSNVTTVRSPDRALTSTLAQTSSVTCNLPGQGEITVTADGGWGGYEYQLLDGNGAVLIDFPNTDPVFVGLSVGTYTINTRDTGSCVYENTITLNVPDAIYADVQLVSPLRCNNDNDAVIQAYNESGGQGPGNYLYQLNRLFDGSSSGLQTTPTFSNLSSGDYTITIYDGWNCSYTTVPITVADPEVIVAELVELQPPGCGDVGRMLLTVTNPEPGVDYFYRRTGTANAFVAFGAGLTSIEISADINLDPGPFQYDVENSNGCPFERSNQISLDAALPLMIDLDLANATINCAGEATGIIRSEAFGGIGNYYYTLLDSDSPEYPTAANTVRAAQESGIFRNLEEGTYYVYANSGSCEAISPPIVIEPKPPLVLEYLEVQPPSCFGNVDGQISIEASGGTGEIRYSISDTLSEFFEGDDPEHPNRKTFINLEPRQYDIIVQDDLGCTITRTITIDEPVKLVGSVVSTAPETCLGDGGGNVQLQVEGGTPPYFTSINSTDEESFVEDETFFFDELNGGETYVFFIRDALGCQTNVSASIPVGITISATSIVEYGCEGIFPNNTVTVNLGDGEQLGQVLFSLDVDNIAMASNERVFGNIAPGEHTVYVFHEDGCLAQTTFEIEAYEPLSLEIGQVSPNEITAIASGGFGDYEYFFQGEYYGSTNTYSLFADEDVEVMVRDRMGCTANVLMPFDFNEVPEIPDFFSPNGDVMNESWNITNSEFFPNLEVKIYDRYGRIVAELDNVTKWDGTYEGNNLPSGDYWYVVNVNDEEQQQWVGHFTLYR